MKCEECGKLIEKIEIYKFYFDGNGENDDWFKESVDPIFDEKEQQVGFRILTDSSWTGYCQSQKEMIEDIRCPHCKKYPIKDNGEITEQDKVEIFFIKDLVYEETTEEILNELQRF